MVIIIIVIYCIDLSFISYKMPLTQTNSNTGLWEAFCKTSNVVGVIILLLLLTEYQNEEYSWSYVRCDHQVLGQDVKNVRFLD